MASLEVSLTSCADLELDAALPAAHASLALFLCSKLGDLQQCTRLRLGLAQSQAGTGQHAAAEETVNQALDDLAGQGNEKLMARAHLTRGRVLDSAGRGEDGLVDYLAAWRIYADNGNVEELAELAGELINLARRINRSDIVEKYSLERERLNVSSARP